MSGFKNSSDERDQVCKTLQYQMRNFMVGRDDQCRRQMQALAKTGELAEKVGSMRPHARGARRAANI
ncbi:MAG: hypothetical protein EB829_05790 [Nitrosopumilus sp. H8]|nr:MAG: hypothetical protein EB829_05790 [Nitrosopumilus sp. H8]